MRWSADTTIPSSDVSTQLPNTQQTEATVTSLCSPGETNTQETETQDSKGICVSFHPSHIHQKLALLVCAV
ncbi:hypothetical protein WJX72_000016 [[Myrmecia] bisecta]|uniref:Uncharacterized protein n=1 Tax=[Myrmecia] bisecta TaxID=41462 RepID=A0AAW1Q346_9CHLO